MNNATHTIRYIDLCTPSYFNGSSNPVFAVIVDGNSTYQDIKDSMLDDYNSNESFPEMDIESALNDFFTTDNMDSIAFPNLEVYSDDNFESCYMYADLVTNS
tara:strand:- start:291 stop:596 length:306 start_codon:yes stop_codon:yes gene_type:complete